MKIFSSLKIALIAAALSYFIAPSSLAFDIGGLQIGDTVNDFENLKTPAKQYLTITHDAEGKIVRILYRQKGLPNNKKIQAKLVNRICNKYGRVTSCSSALSEIESSDKKQFLRFFHLYQNNQETEELRARVRRTKVFSITPDLTVEIDLMESTYAKLLKDQKATTSDLIDF